mmetsp:Transcript_30267/g.42268  ORF Transcript_30267/g.42268 Transcript_30267/m.42268 type:complete len:96 (+) Transcript_30267:1304-1591(+)
MRTRAPRANATGRSTGSGLEGTPSQNMRVAEEATAAKAPARKGTSSFCEEEEEDDDDDYIEDNDDDDDVDVVVYESGDVGDLTDGMAADILDIVL